MSLRLACLEVWTPAVVRRRLLDELARATATAFGCQPPCWTGRSYRDRLDEFARFTDAQARLVLGDGAGTAAEAATALRSSAAALGAELRHRLGIHTQTEAARALRLLYRHIGIDLVVAPDGQVRVRRCLFSNHYTAEVCKLMGSVDDGIAAGITGSGLRFSERLTDGSAECRGRLRVPA